MAHDNTKPTIETRIREGKILPLLIRLAVPMTLAQLVNALYSIVDRMYIARMPGIGTDAIGGLGVALPITVLVSSFASLIGAGGGPLCAIKMGERDNEGAHEVLGNAFSMLLGVGVLLTAIFLIFKDRLLLLFGATQSNLPHASGYIGIYLLGTIFVMLSFGLNNFINTQGFTNMGMATVVIGAVLNTILDPIFIFVLDMGITGAAIATVIAQGVSAVWVVYFLTSGKTPIRIRWRNMKVKFAIAKRICGLGLSMFIFGINDSVIMIFVNNLLRHYGGDLYISSYTLITSVYQVFFMPIKGITQGAQPIISYNYGARNYTRIKETVRWAMTCSMTCAFAMWAAIMFAPRLIISAFTPDAQLIDLTVVTMRIMLCTVFTIGMQMVNQNAFVAMGNVKLSFFFGILRKIIILIPLLIVLPLIFGINGVFAAEAVSNLLTTTITFFVFQNFMKKVSLQFEGEAAEKALAEQRAASLD